MTDFTKPSEIPLTDDEVENLTGKRQNFDVLAGDPEKAEKIAEQLIIGDMPPKSTWRSTTIPPDEEDHEKLDLKEIEKLTGGESIHARELYEHDSSPPPSPPLEEEPPPKPKTPLQFVLSRNQTKKEFQEALLRARTTLHEKRDEIEGCRVPIQGYEGTCLHPAMNPAAKKKYAEAVEWGLVGFLMLEGFQAPAQEVYCMAYVKAQMKSKDRLRFKHIDSKHMVDVTRKSAGVYLELLGH